jgi:hypothetical protein
VTERDIRPFTTGRKNWMFSQSVEGADASAVLYSMVMTCRANDINPYLYFQKLFTELPQRDEFADLSDGGIVIYRIAAAGNLNVERLIRLGSQWQL